MTEEEELAVLDETLCKELDVSMSELYEALHSTLIQLRVECGTFRKKLGDRPSKFVVKIEESIQFLEKMVDHAPSTKAS